jgi:hypothetical protein
MSNRSVGSAARSEAWVRRAAFDWEIDVRQWRLVGHVLDGPQGVEDAFDLASGA